MSEKSTALLHLTDLPKEIYGTVLTYFEVFFKCGYIFGISIRVCAQRRDEKGQVLIKRWLISSHQMI